MARTGFFIFTSFYLRAPKWNTRAITSRQPLCFAMGVPTIQKHQSNIGTKYWWTIITYTEFGNLQQSRYSNITDANIMVPQFICLSTIIAVLFVTIPRHYFCFLWYRFYSSWKPCNCTVPSSAAMVIMTFVSMTLTSKSRLRYPSGWEPYLTTVVDRSGELPPNMGC